MKQTPFTKLLFLSLFLSFLISTQGQIKNFKYEVFTLENGLTVILNPDHTQTQVFGGVVVKAGSKHDPKNHTGIAHYLEHMLFKGTDEIGTSDFYNEKPLLDRISVMYQELQYLKTPEERKAMLAKINETSLEAGKYAIPTEFDKLVRSIGGSGLNAFTSNEITFYFNAFPPHQINKWLELYSHRFINPVFRLFQSELEVVYEEKNMYNDNFVSALIETFMKNLFKNHPYGQQTTIGETEHLKHPSLNKMYEFYNTYYVANNMALVLSGDFKSEEVKPLLNEMFAKWRNSELPVYPDYEEKPFNGRELVKVKMSPIKLGVLGFRTVPVNHPDAYVLDVCNKILSNNNTTGFLDKLALENKIMQAMMLPLARNNDHGAEVVLFIPKIVGQSLNKAELLVLEQFKKLRNGEFDDALLEAVKNELYVDFVSSIEDLQMRTVYLALAFSQNKTVEDFLHYPEYIRNISREAVIEVANKYYGDNYLALHSKMGFPKKEKLEKPGFDPIKPNDSAVSPFAEKFYQIEPQKPQARFINFHEDVKTLSLNPNVNIHYVKNPLNDIYSFKYQIGIGSFEKPILAYAADIMNYAGTKNKSVNELKTAFHNIGTTYSFSYSDSYLYIELKGLEQYFEKALSLLNELLTEPVIEDSKLKIIYNDEKTNRKIEDKEPADVARALVQFVRKSDRSSFIHRLSLKEVKKLTTAELINEFKEALSYSTDIHFTGAHINVDVLAEMIPQRLNFPNKMKPSASPVHIMDNEIKENTVYFINDKKAIQSQIYFLSNGELFDISKEPYYDAFNEYFGGGFSGLVVQEIREYRSMAYATGASFRMPVKAGKPSFFAGYIGTQADKTSEALDVFMSLYRDMPIKKDRLDNLKASLVEEIYSNQPHFRDLSTSVNQWKKMGYDSDPNMKKLEVFKNITFEDIFSFYAEGLKNKPVAICIVGDKKKLDMSHIGQYGKIVELNKKSLYKK